MLQPLNPYANNDGSHKELIEDLKRMSPLVEEKREEFSMNDSW